MESCKCIIYRSLSTCFFALQTGSVVCVHAYVHIYTRMRARMQTQDVLEACMRMRNTHMYTRKTRARTQDGSRYAYACTRVRALS